MAGLPVINLVSRKGVAARIHKSELHVPLAVNGDILQGLLIGSFVLRGERDRVVKCRGGRLRLRLSGYWRQCCRQHGLGNWRCYCCI